MLRGKNQRISMAGVSFVGSEPLARISIIASMWLFMVFVMVIYVNNRPSSKQHTDLSLTCCCRAVMLFLNTKFHLIMDCRLLCISLLYTLTTTVQYPFKIFRLFSNNESVMLASRLTTIDFISVFIVKRIKYAA